VSDVYEKVVKALRSSANQQGDRRIMVNPADYDELIIELGHNDKLEKRHGVPMGTLWTPGSWLLQVPIVKEEMMPAGEVVLEVKTWEWIR
jgi:hypothetical protein